MILNTTLRDESKMRIVLKSIKDGTTWEIAR
jgi:hypothetical protein